MTTRLRKTIQLVPLDCSNKLNDQELRAVLQRNNVRVVDGPAWDCIRPAVEQTIALLNRLPRAAPWGSYLVADAGSREVVGICGFKNAPADGMVEIAYFTFPPYESLGYATATASALAALAESSPLVGTVMARTLMEQNASTRVLTKCGFSLAGEVVDPEDGRVWQWERPADHRGSHAPADFVHV